MKRNKKNSNIYTFFNKIIKYKYFLKSKINFKLHSYYNILNPGKVRHDPEGNIIKAFIVCIIQY